MRKFSIVLGLLLCAHLAACSSTAVASSTIVIPEENSIASYSLPEGSVNLHEFNGLTVAVTTIPEIAITNLFFEIDWRISFSYKTDTLQGEATLFPSYISYFRVDLSTMVLRFQHRENRIYVEAEWFDKWGASSQSQTHTSTDTFMLDEQRNVWVHLIEDSFLYPTNLTKAQAAALFPEIELTQFSFVALLCYQPLYDVRIFRVWDIEQSPKQYDVLLAHYDIYEPGQPFLWQSDSMFKWYLSIQYTDGTGKTRITRHSIYGAVTSVMETPDWELE